MPEAPKSLQDELRAKAADALTTVRADRDRFAQAIERVRALHPMRRIAQPGGDGPPDVFCGRCGVDWPCDTIQVLPAEVTD